MTNPHDAGPHSRGDRPAPGGGEAEGGTTLPDKPILEWTDEDWARWVNSPPAPAAAPAADGAPPAGETSAQAGTGSDPEVRRPVADAEPAAAPEVDDGTGAEAAVAPEVVDGTGVEARLPAHDGPAVTGASASGGAGASTGPGATDREPEHHAERSAGDGRAFEPRDAEPSSAVPEERALWMPEAEREPPEPAAEEPFETLVAAAAFAGEPPAAAADAGDDCEPLAVAAEDAGEPVTHVGAEDTRAQPVPAAEDAEDPETDVPSGPDGTPAPVGADERAWWEQLPRQPPAPEPAARDAAAAAGTVTGVAASVPPTAASIPAAPPAPTPRPIPRRAPTPLAPPAGARPAAAGAQPVVVERSHRVRSAFGLLGVAVLVGTIMAGLITVAVFAISVALKRAVG